jgi:nucleotidyltransferase-like protein
MDDRLSMAPVVPIFAESIRREAGVVAFYVGGSLALGDYRPGRSDLDLAAVIERPLPRPARRALRAFHRSFALRYADAGKLHCAYVPRAELDDVSRPHLAWAHDEMFRRPFSGIARAELHQGGITVYGPPPAELIPPVPAPDLAEAARVELRGYWLGALGRRRRWRTDLHVDLGLTTLARAEATIEEGRLLTKSEAIGRLPSMGVPDTVVAEIARRRAGETVELTDAQRRERGAVVRRLMADGIARLAGEGRRSQ